ncbi:MAG: hypothetical protein ACRDZ1_06425 [Acidimicrobiia bacterium]
MLFEQRFWPGITDGSITMTFRRWKRRQVVAGHRYRAASGIVEVDSVDVVDVSAVTDANARAAGYPSRATLLADLRGASTLPLYRVRFHRVVDPDPRDALAQDRDLADAQAAELDRRLERLDRASPHGPWTAATLVLITERPGVRAADLAARLDRERDTFKQNVRKLKELGLTISLEVGYRLSPRGEAYLRRRGS